MITTRKPASALLMVLLFMTAITSLTLYFLKESSARQSLSNGLKDSTMARQLAQTGLTRGHQLLVEKLPKYAQISFAGASSCAAALEQSLVNLPYTALSPLDRQCGRIEVQIEDSVTIQSKESYAIRPDLLPYDTSVNFTLSGGSVSLQLDVNDVNGTVSLNEDTLSQITSAYRKEVPSGPYFKLKTTNKHGLTGKGLIITAKDDDVVITKAEKTVLSRGYFGNSSFGLLSRIPFHGGELTVEPFFDSL
jgi:Tfp pilus assembly protein PilX